MWKSALTVAIALATTSARAETFPASKYGLTPDTGYVDAVTPDEPCGGNNVLVLKASQSGLSQDMIYKCDGSLIGWVTRSANGADLGSGEYTVEDLDNSNVMLAHGRKENGQLEEINIYVCDRSRADELEKDKSAEAANNPRTVIEKLNFVAKHKLNFRIQLFYNDYELSGKCIGKIDILP